MKNTISLLALLALLSALPGCIVGEIRDELKSANTQLTQVHVSLEKLDKTNEQLTQVQVSLEKLDKTNDQLAATNEQLTRTAALITGVEHGLARIDATNTSLGSVDQRLVLLQSINTSLGRLDTHLASLRKTISSIDSVIPFVDLGGDEPVPEPAAQPAAAAEAATTTPAAEAGAAPPADAAGAPPAAGSTIRTAMLGAWVSRYPDDRIALILLADGRFILARHTDTPPNSERRGTWKRQDRSIILEEDARAGKTPDGKEVDMTERHTLEIVMSAGRSVTAHLDNKLMILTRP